MRRVALFFIILTFSAIQLHAQRVLKTLNGHTNSISGIEFSVNGKVLVSSSWDKTIRIWNPISGETNKIIETGKSVVFSCALAKDMKTVVVASWSPAVVLYSTVTGEKLKSFMAHPTKVDYVTYSYDGKQMLTCGDDTIKVWDATTLAFKASLAGHAGDVNMAIFSPDGKHIASNSSTGVIKIWAAQSGELVKSLYAHINNSPTVVFSHDGKRLFTLGEEGTVKAWNTEDYSLLQTYTKIVSGANDMDINVDGRTIALAGKDNNAYLFDIVDMKILSTLQAHSRPVTHLCFSPDGTLLATAGEDNKIVIWDVSDLRYRECVELKMKEHSEMKAPKGEFETTEQYKKRLGEYEKLKYEKKKECMKEEALKNVEQQAQKVENLIDTYKHVSLNIQEISTYDADRQTFEIKVEGLKYTLKIPLSEARSFKEVWRKAVVKGIQRANPSTKKAEYINLQVVHPLTNVAYPCGTQVSPATDKYLKEFLEKNPEPKG